MYKRHFNDWTQHVLLLIGIAGLLAKPVARLLLGQ